MLLSKLANPEIMALTNYIGRHCDDQGGLYFKLHALVHPLVTPEGNEIHPEPKLLYDYLLCLSSYTYPNPAANSFPRAISLVRIHASRIGEGYWSATIGVAPIRAHFKELPIRLWDAFMKIEGRLGKFGFESQVDLTTFVPPKT